jgi:dihydropteroate synthase
MGICNVTPDSFSDGGRYLSDADALEHATRMVELGADLIDVGGESTRPGADRVPLEVEMARVIPVIKGLVSQGTVVSVDTMRSEVASAAVAAGAAIINDVSGGSADPAMPAVMAELGQPVILTHSRGKPADMDRLDNYADVVAEVAAELERRVGAVVEAGVKPEAIVLDPGFGFAKASSNNWPLLAQLDRLAGLGFPLAIGVSRKRFLESVKGPSPHLQALGPAGRDAATAAVTAASSLVGVWCVRVHAVAGSAAAVRVAQEIRAARLAALARGAASPAEELPFLVQHEG